MEVSEISTTSLQVSLSLPRTWCGTLGPSFPHRDSSRRRLPLSEESGSIYCSSRPEVVFDGFRHSSRIDRDPGSIGLQLNLGSFFCYTILSILNILIINTLLIINRIYKYIRI